MRLAAFISPIPALLLLGCGNHKKVSDYELIQAEAGAEAQISRDESRPDETRDQGLAARTSSGPSVQPGINGK